MGSLLVIAMGRGIVEELSSSSLHHFFSKVTVAVEPSGPTAGRASSNAENPTVENPMPDIGDGDTRKRRCRTQPSEAQQGPEVKKVRHKKKIARPGDSSQTNGIMSHLARVDHTSISDSALSYNSDVGRDSAALSGDTSVRPETTRSTDGSLSDTTYASQASKKILKFNPKTGIFIKPSEKKQKISPSRIVRIRYGGEDTTRRAIGAQISQILDGGQHKSNMPTIKRGNEPLATINRPPEKPSDNQAAFHPFFTAKTKPPSTEKIKPLPSTQKASAPPRNTVFMSTPMSPRKQTNPFHPRRSDKAFNPSIRPFGPKIPGALHPMWPSAGMSHVRAEDPGRVAVKRWTYPETIGKKSKGQVTTIKPEELLLTNLLEQLDLESARSSLPQYENSFLPPPAELRLPRRRFEGRRKLQKRIRSQLTTSILTELYDGNESSQDELSTSPQPKPHPAVLGLYLSLETQLSAFDRSSCESLTWVQKYAPKTAAQVLQTGREAFLLKEWLQALQVQSLKHEADTNTDRAKSKPEASSKRRKRKARLEGFIVDSDEESSELDELSVVGDDRSAADGLSQQSVVRNDGDLSRSLREPGKLRNTIVISGPHGCGKTAAVYAVAKEIGFEVFEINPSSRRSGKDILDRVGDMTRNHLVQQQRVQSSLFEDEAGDSIQSTRMAAFFRSTLKTKGPRQASQGVKHGPNRQGKAVKSKPQKQSMILLEEADVLYEEDKQFWATLMGMMKQSKRPFVVTCSDESLIPIQCLRLHAIFRFSPPPSNLAVDVCLLIAANEGHMLEKAAVESLYRSRGHDLRASISELNFWCQIGVGDRRGGFDWFYPRWPRGSDVDESGDVVRVVSEGTYLGGMGWIGRDLVAVKPRAQEAEQEALRQAWDSWQLDLGDWHGSLDVRAARRIARRGSVNAEALAAYDDFCEMMSMADVCSGGIFGTKLQEELDWTLPRLPSGVREDYILGQTLLEADAATLWTTTTRAATATTLKSLAREVLRRWTVSASGGRLGDVAPGLEAVGVDRAITLLDASFRALPSLLTRRDISDAFDAIAAAPKAQAAVHLDPSVFDRPMRLIVVDVAPWVRGILAFEKRLMKTRLLRNSLLNGAGGVAPSDCGISGIKRMRTTRAAYSALEGSQRGTTRRERYFGDCLDSPVIMRTGAPSFHAAVDAQRDTERPGPGSPPATSSPSLT